MGEKGDGGKNKEGLNFLSARMSSRSERGGKEDYFKPSVMKEI